MTFVIDNIHACHFTVPPAHETLEPMADIVSVTKLTKKYGELVAVDNLSFTVEEGEIFGFLGPNGAGKSTTLNVLCTLTDYNKGDITICGHDLATNERAIKALIGLVPQEIALYPLLTAYENVAFFASLYGLGGARLRRAAEEALGFVGLADQAKKQAGKLSGGMKRRLNIACGIAHSPTLIVMDEPTVGVDAQSREHIMESIRVLRQRGATIIYTSHYMPEVQEICDRIAIIDHGRLVAIGTEEELLEVVTDMKTITIETRLASGTDPTQLTHKLTAIPDVRRVSYDEENGQFKLDVALSFTAVSPILQVMMDAEASIYKVNTEAPDLETTFLALTGRELR